MKSKRCRLCKREKPTTPVLMVGEQGYRRYPLCAECARIELEKQEAKQNAGNTGKGMIK
jgi:hypothetical protein